MTAEYGHYPDSDQEINQGKNVNRAYGLTVQQRALLNFIEAFSAVRGIMPSYQEMADALGLCSKSGVHRLVTTLERKGHLSRQPASARALRVIGHEDVSTIAALSVVLDRVRLTRDTAGELKLALDLEYKLSGVDGA